MGLSIAHSIGIPSISWSSYCTPLNLILTEITGGIKLTWQENSPENIDGYEIWVSIGGNTYVLLNTVSANVLTYDDMTDYAGSTVEYKVRAYKGTVYSSYSDEKSITINYQAELTAYIAGLATPLSDGQKSLLNAFIVSLKVGFGITNLSDQFDAMWILAGETAESSLKNLVKDDHHCTPVNSPTFTALEGFTGNGSTMRIRTDYIPSSDSVRFGLDDASVGFYERTASAAGVNVGGQNAAGGVEAFSSEGGTLYTQLNCGYNITPGIATVTSLPFVCLVRNNATTYNVYRRTTKTVFTKNSVGLCSVEMQLLCGAVNAGYQWYSASQLSFAFFGKGMDDTKEAVLYNAIQTYMTANSKEI